jgi:hypothetical protein
MEIFLRLPVPQNGGDLRGPSPKHTNRILVFGKFPNPTFDYYFAARLKAPGMPAFKLVDVRNFESDTVEADGSFVIIVRYSSFAASKWLIKHSDALSGIAVFLDDDVAAAIASPEATLGYRYRLLRDCVLPLRMLDQLVSDVWVSTKPLAARLQYSRPLIVPPAPDDAVLRSAPLRDLARAGGSVSIAYHATAIHSAEHEFLLPVVAKVLQSRLSVTFEVFANGRSASLWSSLGSERVSIKPQLPWQDYLREQTKPIDIMLVPVAPSRLNDCRADTKRIDTVRVGAAAVLSDCPAYRPGEEGEILLPYDQARWTQKIIELVDSPEARANAANASAQRVRCMVQRAQQGIPFIERAEA